MRCAKVTISSTCIVAEKLTEILKDISELLLFEKQRFKKHCESIFNILRKRLCTF